MKIQTQISEKDLKKIREVRIEGKGQEPDFVMDIYKYDGVIVMWRKDVIDEFAMLMPNGIVLSAPNGYRANVNATNYNFVLRALSQGSDEDVRALYELLSKLQHDEEKEIELLNLLGYPLKVKNKRNHVAIYYSDISHQLMIMSYLKKHGDKVYSEVYCFEDGGYEPCSGEYEEETEEDEEEWCYEVERHGGKCETPPEEWEEWIEE